MTMPVKIRQGLLIIGIAFIISMTLGIVSCEVHDVITSSFIYILYPLIFSTIILINYFITWIFSRNLAFVIAIVLSIMNVIWNILQLVFVLNWWNFYLRMLIAGQTQFPGDADDSIWTSGFISGSPTRNRPEMTTSHSGVRCETY